MCAARRYSLWGEQNDKWEDSIEGLYCHSNSSGGGTYAVHASTISTSASGDLVVHTSLLDTSGFQLDNAGASSINLNVNDGYYLYAGGVNLANNNIVNTVRVYNDSFTRLTDQTLMVARKGSMGVELDTACLFVGGEDAQGNNSNVIDVFDKFLTRTNKLSLSYDNYRPSVATMYDNYNNRFMGLVNDQGDSELENFTLEVFYQEKETDLPI